MNQMNLNRNSTRTSVRPYLVVPAFLLGFAVLGLSPECWSDGPAPAKPAGKDGKSAPLTFCGMTAQQIMDGLNGDSEKKMAALQCIVSKYYAIDIDELPARVFGLTNDEDSTVRSRAFVTLLFCSHDWRQFMIPALSSPHADIVCVALTSCPRAGPVGREVLDKIRSLSTDSRERVALEASYTLWSLTDERQELQKCLVAGLASEDLELCALVLSKICASPEIGPLVKEQLPDMLKSNSHMLATLSAIAMINCNISADLALQWLKKQMTNNDLTIKGEVITFVAIYNHRHPELVRTVLSACRDSAEHVRLLAQRTIAYVINAQDLPRDKTDLFRDWEDDDVEFILSHWATRDIITKADIPLLERYQNSRNEDLSMIAELLLAKHTGRWDEAEKRVSAILDSAPVPSDKLEKIPLYALQRPAMAIKVLDKHATLELKQQNRLLGVAITAGPNDPAVKDLAKRLVISTEAEVIGMAILELRNAPVLPEWGIDLLRRACATPNRSLRRLACNALLQKSQAKGDLEKVFAVSRSDNWQQYYPSDLACLEFVATKDSKALALRLGQLCKSRGIDAALSGLEAWERTVDDETLDRSLASIIGTLSIADRRIMAIRIERRQFPDRILGRPILKRGIMPAAKEPSGVE